MRNAIDFSSWQGVLSTLLGLIIVSLVAVGIRLLVMHSVQQRRERQNRQINERLKTLIAAYKVLGGSFTGNLTVDPSHLRDLRVKTASGEAATGPRDNGTSDAGAHDDGVLPAEASGSDRRRRIRDAVEAALSDVILLGTEEQVKLAAHAASEMVAGRPVEIAELVVSLRAFIREVLELDPIPVAVAIPRQGPVRASSTAARGARGDKTGGTGGGGRGGAGQAGGDGMGGIGGMGPHHDGAIDTPHGPDHT